EKDAMTRRWIAVAMVLALVAGTAAAQERTDASQGTGDRQSYPNRVVRIIVPFPPGGPTDILTRVLGQRMNEVWGQPDREPAGPQYRDRGRALRQNAARRLPPVRRDGCHDGAKSHHRQQSVL